MCDGNITHLIALTQNLSVRLGMSCGKIALQLSKFTMSILSVLFYPSIP